MKTKIKKDIEISSNHFVLEMTDTGFSISVICDPEQHNVYLHFHHESAESIKEVIDKYIKVRDNLNQLTHGE